MVETFNLVVWKLSLLWEILLWISSLFLIVLVLVQRGRGGGLTGALGGMGGQSAFGAKAGDVFTRITVIVASCWIVLCILMFYAQSHPQRRIPDGGGPPTAPQ
jgi:preprotein translocase subunit SecG